jgi:hypothetical protein
VSSEVAQGAAAVFLSLMAQSFLSNTTVRTKTWRDSTRIGPWAVIAARLKIAPEPAKDERRRPDIFIILVRPCKRTSVPSSGISQFNVQFGKVISPRGASFTKSQRSNRRTAVLLQPSAPSRISGVLHAGKVCAAVSCQSLVGRCTTALRSSRIQTVTSAY